MLNYLKSLIGINPPKNNLLDLVRGIHIGKSNGMYILLLPTFMSPTEGKELFKTKAQLIKYLKQAIDDRISLFWRDLYDDIEKLDKLEEKKND